MGEIAEMMLDGTLDCETGEYLGEGDGYPRSLSDHHVEGIVTNWPPKPKDTKCPMCQKMVRGVEAVHQHMKDKHRIVKKRDREAALQGEDQCQK